MRKKTLQGGALLFASKGITQICVFARNVIIARAIGVENFGIAAMFSMTVAILDMLGSLSVGQMLIQAKDGEDERLQATAQAITALRGAFSGLLLLVCAAPLARLFDVPHAVDAFRWLAFIPVLRGLVHLDQQRKQRDLDYGSAVVLDVIRELLPLLLAWPFALWLEDYRAMLWLLVAQSGLHTLFSHILAGRKYLWHWNRSLAARFMHFGWPLVLNNLLLFFIYQGDRLLIGSAGTLFGSSFYKLHDLGIYSVALSLTLVPTMALGTISTSLMLPLFSAAQSTPDELQKRYMRFSQIIALLSGFFTLPFVVSGGWLVAIIYGSDYAAAGAFIGWLAVAQAIRMARYAPTSVAMACADTTNALYSNIIRCLAFVATTAVIAHDGSLHWIAIAGCFGEFAAWLFCLWQLSRRHRVPVRLGLSANIPVLIFVGGSALLSLFVADHPMATLSLLGALVVLFLGLMLSLHPFLRSLVRLDNVRLLFLQQPKP